MRGFEFFNPAALFFYFAAVTLICVFCFNPVTALCALFGALAFCIVKRDCITRRTHIFAFLLFAAVALINPLFNHNGKTALFFLNNNPVTLEAFVYGLVSGAMITAVYYQMRVFSKIMTTDKVMYILSRVSSKAALIFSMSVRFIPLFRERFKKTSDAQRAMGQNRESNIIEKTRSAARVFSAVVSWGIENGITTADSMAARGYGSGRRTSFAIFRFDRRDLVFTAAYIILLVPAVMSLAKGSVEFEFYPEIKSAENDAGVIASYISYALLCLIPALTQMIAEKKRWKFFR